MITIIVLNFHKAIEIYVFRVNGDRLEVCCYDVQKLFERAGKKAVTKNSLKNCQAELKGPLNWDKFNWKQF